MAAIEGPVALPTGATSASEASRLREVSEKLEAAFLAEMLKAAGVGETPSTFGGGAGEDQFSSFLRQAQAEAMARAGGIGLAERLFQSLTREPSNEG